MHFVHFLYQYAHCMNILQQKIFVRVFSNISENFNLLGDRSKSGNNQIRAKVHLLDHNFIESIKYKLLWNQKFLFFLKIRGQGHGTQHGQILTKKLLNFFTKVKGPQKSRINWIWHSLHRPYGSIWCRCSNYYSIRIGEVFDQKCISLMWP